MGRIFGYIRKSKKSQNLDRQRRNILAIYPNADIRAEAFSGRIISRPEFNKLINELRAGDKIVFDSVSRMSRNKEEGYELYMELFDKNIEIEFIKESYINTEVYRSALGNNISDTGTDIDILLRAVREYLDKVAKNQIYKAFEQAEKEVEDLRQRTKEGLLTAKLNGKHIGVREGQKLVTLKSRKAKVDILKYNKTFGGPLDDADTKKMAEISRNSFYKYKKELIEEINNGSAVEDIRQRLISEIEELEKSKEEKAKEIKFYES